MERSKVFKNLIIDFITLLSVLERKSSNQYRRIFNSFLLVFKAQLSSRSSTVTSDWRLQRKRQWNVVPVLRPQLYIRIYCSSKTVPAFIFIQNTKIRFNASIFEACIRYCLFFLQMIPFRNYEKRFLFDLKKFFRSRDVQIL